MQPPNTLDIEAALDNMAKQLQPLFAHSATAPLIIGIHTGGYWVAEALHKRLNCQEPLGSVAINFYRDDFSRVGVHPSVGETHIPQSVDDRTILLVDDVLQTGRTIRAAMNALFDYGRPHAIQLAVLLDRGCRELPVAADVAGITLDIPAAKQIKLIGPTTMEFQWQ